MADRTAVVSPHRFIRLTLRTPISIYDPPVAVAPTGQHQDASDLGLFDKLKSMRSLKLPWSAGRYTPRKGIVLQQAALAIFINGLRPGLKRRHAIGIRQVAQDSLIVHR